MYPASISFEAKKWPNPLFSLLLRTFPSTIALGVTDSQVKAAPYD